MFCPLDQNCTPLHKTNAQAVSSLGVHISDRMQLDKDSNFNIPSFAASPHFRQSFAELSLLEFMAMLPALRVTSTFLIIVSPLPGKYELGKTKLAPAFLTTGSTGTVGAAPPTFSRAANAPRAPQSLCQGHARIRRIQSAGMHLQRCLNFGSVPSVAGALIRY